MEQYEINDKEFKAGYIAIVGKPNVGKSTLMNALIGHKLSIVSPKPQTTRHRVLGILSRENYQAIFLDTPGLINPKYELQKSMVSKIHQALIDADLIVVIIDVEETNLPNDLVKLVSSQIKPSVLVINKCDLVKRNEVLPLIEKLHQEYSFNDIVPISALQAENLDELEKTILQYLPIHPPFYPPDQISEQPERFFVAELIREQIFLMYSQEIPYSTAVLVVDFKEQEGRKDLIRAEIIVDRESQKPIIIGKGGKKLKELGSAARKQIEEFLGRPVFLELFVKTREKWRSSEQWVQRFGY